MLHDGPSVPVLTRPQRSNRDLKLHLEPVNTSAGELSFNSASGSTRLRTTAHEPRTGSNVALLTTVRPVRSGSIYHK